MKEEKGTLKNTTKEWNTEKHQRNQDKKNIFTIIQNITDNGKKALKNTFGKLFMKIENIGRDSNKKNIETVESVNIYNTTTNISEDNIQIQNDEITKEYAVEQEKKPIDIEMIQNKIEENLQEQTNDVDELKKRLNETDIKNKRAVIIAGIHNSLSKTMNIGISLSTSFRENKILGMLARITILNNRLRNLRKILRKENKDIDFITFANLEELSNEVICTEKINELLDDAIYQLKTLKQEFIMEFYYDMDRYQETEDIMTAFSSIEYQITSQSIELEESDNMNK